jgi:hypothetical protein
MLGVRHVIAHPAALEAPIGTSKQLILCEVAAWLFPEL